jgi:HEAT repeat protein
MSDTLESLLANLQDPREPVKSALLYRLSSPIPEDLEALKAIWLRIPETRRRLLLSRMLEAAEASFELDFREVATFALDDEDAEVRSLAIANLWEDVGSAFMEKLLDILENDIAEQARSAAAQSLGRYVLLGELGKYDSAKARLVEEALLLVCDAPEETLEVQRRALEALSYSGRDEVPSLIEDAYHHSEPKMRASALFAMGQSADERWTGYVMASLSDQSPELRYEAVRAAGELEIAEALPRLIELMRDSDREVVEAAIWSVGMVGGASARQALLLFSEQTYDEALLEMIEDALGLTILADGEFGFFLFDMDDPGDDFNDDYNDED